MRLLIAGGGTGGHLFPGIALAEEVTGRNPANEVLFVGTRRGLEARVVPQNGFQLQTITSRGLKGVGLSRGLLGLLALPVSFLESAWWLLRFKPDVVVGVGGYSSGPVVMAAWLMGVPTAVQEQNALPGLTNKLLGRVVKSVFLAFDDARRFFPRQKVHVLGNPIRRKLLDNYLRSTSPHDKFTVLVVGGSLGAKGLNARIVQGLEHLSDLKTELKFIHQTGKGQVDAVRAEYEKHGFEAEVVEFIDDMSTAYAKSELVICRAGATTLAELTVCKKASILVPFPFATDDHQAVNASALVDAGAAVMFREAELDGKKLADQVRALKADGKLRKKMEKAAGLLGRPEAASEIADVCIEMMGKRWGEKGRPRKTKEKSK